MKKDKIKKIAKEVLPPIILKFLKRKNNSRFSGDYQDWGDAINNSKGYNDQEILEKVKKSLLRVKNGDAVYERDSVLFDKIEYSWPVLASLLWIAIQHNNQLNLIDFGGSLGSTYYQNKYFLSHFKKIRWNIIEQKDFVNCGKKFFQDDILYFYSSLSDCLNTTSPDVVLISGTIQYLEDPYKFIEECLGRQFKYIIFDRTTFLSNRDRLTVQKVPVRIYDASYPAWFINQTRFLNLFQKDYNLIADFDALGGLIDLGDDKGFTKGFIFKRK